LSRLGRLSAAALASGAVTFAALLPAAALGGAQAASNHLVSLRNFHFHPGSLTIRRGDTVTWLWQDQAEHNVTFKTFHSRTQIHGSYTVRFTRSGTFNYRCTLHVSEGMIGKIIVH
jgi:plastocyanin